MAPIARSNRQWALALGIAALAVTPAMASGQGAAADSQSLVVAPRAPTSPDRALAPSRGIRPLGRDAEQLLADARRLSPTVRRLLAELETSDVLVYLEIRPRPLWLDHPGLQRTAPSVLALLGGGAGLRYLKIEIYSCYGSDRISWLGHELQHAVEIASAPDVTDDAGVKRLYRRIGRPSRTGRDAFETAAAIRVRNQVMDELASARAKKGAAGALALRQPPDGR
jgi:hypothetical protein